MWTRITVKGRITASPNPIHQQYFFLPPGGSYNLSGQYGPMGLASQELTVKVKLRFRINNQISSAWGFPTYQFGASDEEVVVYQNALLFKNGADVLFNRNALQKTASCGNCGPGGTPLSASHYVVAGEQTMVVEAAKKTLDLTATPNDVYEGTTVRFEAKDLLSNQAVTVREWRWYPDSSAVPEVPSCGGSSAVCDWAPPTSGRMFVKARVGTNYFYEQASAEVFVRPVQFVALTDRPGVGVGDSTTIRFYSIPARPITYSQVEVSAHVPTPAANLGTKACSDAALSCVVQVYSSGYVRILANVGGKLKTADVWIDTVPCPTKDELLDNPQFRSLLRMIDSVTSATTPTKEFTGTIYQDTVTGAFRVKFEPDIGNANTCTTSEVISARQSNEKLVAFAHSHPANVGQQVCGVRIRSGPHGKSPSDEDWGVVSKFGVPGFVVDPGGVLRFNPPTAWDTVTVRGRNRIPTTVVQPPRSEINAIVKSTKRGQACFL